MKTVAIIQARMTSTRLPGKVLMDLAGAPMLSQQLRRLSISKELKDIVVATTVNRTDDPLVALCDQEHIRWFRGSENDVLARYVGAAGETNADIVVRITSDCPLIDAEIVDQVVRGLADNSGQFDYSANILDRTYPRGLDVEAFTVETLRRLDQVASSTQDREHVTSYLRGAGRNEFTSLSVKDSEDNSDLRWTVDTAIDLKLARTIYQDLKLGEQILPYCEILRYVRSHPELAVLNASAETWDPTKS